MTKFICTALVGAACWFCTTDCASAGQGCGCSVGCAAPASMPGMPGMPAQAAAPQGYRTFSYQPTYGAYSRSRVSGRSTVRAYESGNNKSLGRGF